MENRARMNTGAGLSHNGPTPLWILTVSTLGLAVVVGLAVMGIVNVRQRSTGAGTGAGASPAVVTTSKAQATIFRTTPTEPAVVQPPPVVTVTPDRAAWIKQLKVKKGDKVKTGQTIAVIEPVNAAKTQALEDYQAAVDRIEIAKADMESAKSSLALAQSSVASIRTSLEEAEAELTKARSRLSQSDSELSKAEQNLSIASDKAEQHQKLYEIGVISRQELEETKAAQQQASKSVIQVRKSIEDYKTDVIRAEAAVNTQRDRLKKAQASLVQARENTASMADELRLRRSALLQAQSRVQTESKNSKPINLTSPVDGTITAVTMPEGTLITPAINAAQIRPVGVNTVVFNTLEENTAGLKTGTPIYISTPRSTSRLAGKITAVDPDRAGRKSSRITARITGSQVIVKPGEKVIAALPAKETKAVTVPASAIGKSGSDSIVWTVNKNRAVMKQVTVYPGSGRVVIVTRGLKAGDEVVIDSTVPLRQGSPVVVKAAR